MLPKEIEERLPLLFGVHFGEEFMLRAASMLNGGSINNALLLRTNLGDFFLKYNLSDKYPEMFESEAKGLQLIENSLTIKTPKVIFADKSIRYSFLVLEYIPEGSKTRNFWTTLGINLGRLHKEFSEHPGLDHNNYIGSLRQNNEPCDSWIDFFINRRINPMLKKAVESGLADTALINSFERLFNKLPSIFPSEKPSLIHGDLWRGNFITGRNDEAYLIDPAVYFGSREMDIAMSRLFGGFENEFYEVYNEYFPMEPGWEKRVDICNLYPLLVHLNLFGAGYLNSIVSILGKF